MKRALTAVLPALVALGLVPATSRAADEQPAADAAPVHRFSVYSRGGVQAYLSPTRSTGMFGGSFGVRDIIQDRFILQADVGYLMNFGNVVPVQVAAGMQHRLGFYTPAALVTLTGFLGERVTFLDAEHPSVNRVPPIAAGVLLAPARFTLEGAQLSILEFGVGVSPEFPGLGVAYQLNLIDVGVSF
ncbi:hypothetical protein BO221_11980 [Archangium sp. Cb G35]|uniref:hypothetical protein n=1 Tax=Archangium sp. Cb G35 TaxID=1920190 RepID=UPI0009364843|nr:hypothetical protein [Archangium sp. Cb G35]OJT25090.1 hypothetical protein BO221_11980 [Archangium sp. Cb G35]